MRILIVLCLGIVATVVASAVFLIPSYVISFGTYAEVENEKENLNRLIAAKQTDEAAGDIKAVSDTLNALKAHTTKRDPTRIFERIVQDKPSGISIVSFNFTPESDAGVTVDISGRANTRSALSAYVDVLKKDAAFAGVSIPLSNFARERDIGFNLKLQVNTSPEFWIVSSPHALEIDLNDDAEAVIGNPGASEENQNE